MTWPAGPIASSRSKADWSSITLCDRTEAAHSGFSLLKENGNDPADDHWDYGCRGGADAQGHPPHTLKCRSDISGECRKFGIVSFASAMGAERHAFIGRDDVEMQVEHGLPGRRFVELSQPDTVSASRLLHRPRHFLHQRHNRSQRCRVGIKQVA